MRLYNYRKEKLRKFIFLFFILLLLISIIVWVFAIYISNKLYLTFADKAKNNISLILNKTLLDYTENNKIRYDDFIVMKYTYDKADVVIIDTIKVNNFISKLMVDMNQKLNNLTPIEIKLRLGYITNNVFLNDWGPIIKGRLLSISIIDSNIDSELLEAGINQTLHRISLNIDIRCEILFINNKKISLRQKIPLVEHLYIGSVPKVYLGE